MRLHLCVCAGVWVCVCVRGMRISIFTYITYCIHKHILTYCIVWMHFGLNCSSLSHYPGASTRSTFITRTNTHNSSWQNAIITYRNKLWMLPECYICYQQSTRNLVFSFLCASSAIAEAAGEPRRQTSFFSAHQFAQHLASLRLRRKPQDLQNLVVPEEGNCQS